MAIYRGEGGAGDATADASNAAALADSFADAANASAGQAAASAASALAAKVAAELAETNAELAETNAETAEAAAEAVLTDAGFIVVAADLQGTDTIGTVATNIANVNAVGNNIANVNAVNANEANINTVAGISANVTTVAGISSNVTTVATNNANVTTVAGSIANVNTNATNIANINQNAANIVAIQNASANATAAASSATAAAGSATSASASAAAASAVALGNEPVRHSVRPSLLLDFANTKTLDPRITFTRASTGTYYDGKTVAKAEENLFIYSQEFDNAAWPKVSAIVTANSTTAPDGTTTAETLTETATTAAHYIIQTNSTFTSGLPYIYSVYVKKGTGASARDFIQLGFTATPFGSNAYANFNISTGSVTLTGAGVSSASITDAGNGWWRCAIFDTPTSTASGSVFITCITTSTAVLVESFAGSVDANVFIWGAQLEQRSAVSAYTVTTTAPITNYIPALQTAAAGVARFEHNPVTGESLGLEIEEQRTNLNIYSDDFANAAWTKTRASITSNTIISPDGTLNGDKLVEDTTATNTHTTFVTAITSSATTAYTFTVYAKASERSWLNIQLTSTPFGTTTRAWFDLSTGSLGTQTNGTATITLVGNGWYRCSFTATTTVGGSLSGSLLLATGNNSSSYTGDGYSGIYIWGAQLEAGSFATSYIPTVASQVTRSADAASMTGTNFSSWYRADEGTLYAEANYKASASVSAGLATLTDNPLSQQWFSIFASTTGIAALRRLNGVAGSTIVSTNSLGTAGNIKASFSYKVAGTDAVVNNGGTVVTANGLTNAPANTQLLIGTYNTGSNPTAVNGTVRKIAYYAKQLTNAEIQSLTTI